MLELDKITRSNLATFLAYSLCKMSHHYWKLGISLVCCVSAFSACGDNKGTGGQSIEDYYPELPPESGAGQLAFAGPITTSNTQELIPGPASSGVIGDYFMRNGEARFVIGAPTPFVGIVTPGGNLVDAAAIAADGSDESPDHFGETAILYQMGRQCRHSSIEIVRDGSGGGPAVLRAHGMTGFNQHVNLRGLGVLPIPNSLLPELDDGAECATTYILDPGSKTLETHLTLFNPTEELITGPMGALSDTGGEVFIFLPGTGFSRLGDISEAINGGGTESAYMAWQGPDVAYGIIPRHGDVNTPNGSISILGVSVYFFGVKEFLDALQGSKNKFFRAEGGQGFTFQMDVFVGRDAADVEREFQRLSGGATVEISGNVSFPEGGPASGVRVGIFRDNNSDGEVDSEDTIVSYINGLPDGSYSGAIPAGSYLLRAEIAGLARSSAVAVSTTSGAAEANLSLDKPVQIDYRVVDDGDADALIPARITIIGEHPMPPDLRTYGKFDFFTGIVRSQMSQRGTSTDLGDGADAPILLPAGDYRALVSRGTEWSIAEVRMTIASGDTPPEQEFRLRRLVDTSGYISSEYHVHSIGSPDSPIPNDRRVATALADGIEFYATTDHDYISEHQSIIEAQGLDRMVRSIAGAEISPLVYGHFNAWPLERDPDSPTGGAVDWPLGNGDFVMSPSEIFSAARGLGAELVQVNHPRKGLARSSDITEHFDRMALAFDYENKTFQGVESAMPVPVEWLRLPPESGQLFSDEFNSLEVWNGFGMMDTNGDGVMEMANLDIVMRDWFNFLSFGKQVAPIASSDTHTEVIDAMGMPRTMVRVSDDSSSAILSGTSLTREILDVLQGAAGKFVDLIMTDGPQLAITVDGDDRPLGKVIDGSSGTIELKIDVQSPDWAEIDTIEIFSNATPEVGQVISSELYPIACFTTRISLEDNDPCQMAGLGGAATLTVNSVDLGGGFSRFESSITVSITPSDIPVRAGSSGTDAWFVIRVRGTRSIYPLFVGNLFEDEDVSIFVDGDANAVENALLGRGRPATAITSAFYVDFDGAGFKAQFAP